jgi:hypothetical protein
MLALAGPFSEVHFTHLSDSSALSLGASIGNARPILDKASSRAAGAAHTSDILAWLLSRSISIDRVCLLDPKATLALAPEDGDGHFSCFLFGVSANLVQYLITMPNVIRRVSWVREMTFSRERFIFIPLRLVRR